MHKSSTTSRLIRALAARTFWPPPPRNPDFYLIGATRSGTTYLYHVLKSHPRIFMPRRKEIHYFNDDRLFRENLAGYRDFFAGYRGEALIGENTPLYLEKSMVYDRRGKLHYGVADDAMARIARLNPSAKLIVTLRDPLARLRSMHAKNWHQGKITTSISEEIACEAEGRSKLNLVARNCYDMQLENVFRHFHRKQVLVLVFEEWTKDNSLASRAITEFLGCPPFPDPLVLPARARNEGGRYATRGGMGTSPSDIAPDLRADILAMTAPGRRFVTELLGRKLPWVES